MFVTSPCRVWLQHGCCCAHHARLHARHLPDLLQLLPGDLRAHPAAVCGPGSGNSLRRCTPAPHTTGIGHRATAPSSATVSQPSHVYKDTLCCLWIKCLTVLLFLSFGDPWSPRWHSRSWWRRLHPRKGVPMEDSGDDCWDLWLFPYRKDLFIFCPISWPCKSSVFVTRINLMTQEQLK